MVESLRKSPMKLAERFMGLLAHEIRSPLNGARLALGQIDRNPTDVATVTNASQIAQRQLNRLAHLVNDLFDMSRITEGKMPLDQELLSVNSLMNQVLEDSVCEFEVKGHELVVGTLPQDVYLLADEGKLRQVFGNLLGNAAKFTSAPGTIHFTAEIRGSQVVFRVRDNGVGISPDSLPIIFDLYAQEGRSPNSGLGIGLALVKKLVELHEGTVVAFSEGPGYGAEFQVSIPVSDQVPFDEKEDDQGCYTKTASKAVRPTCILVVDDDRISANTLSNILALDGHRVETAYSGREAIQKARVFGPDVIAMDITLPDIQGYDVALQMQAFLPNSCYVAMTGLLQGEFEGRCFNHHLIKPIDLDALASIIADRK